MPNAAGWPCTARPDEEFVQLCDAVLLSLPSTGCCGRRSDGSWWACNTQRSTLQHRSTQHADHQRIATGVPSSSQACCSGKAFSECFLFPTLVAQQLESHGSGIDGYVLWICVYAIAGRADFGLTHVSTSTGSQFPCSSSTQAPVSAVAALLWLFCRRVRRYSRRARGWPQNGLYGEAGSQVWGRRECCWTYGRAQRRWGGRVNGRLMVVDS